jgi:hypothetical protein
LRRHFLDENTIFLIICKAKTMLVQDDLKSLTCIPFDSPLVQLFGGLDSFVMHSDSIVVTAQM